MSSNSRIRKTLSQLILALDRFSFTTLFASCQNRFMKPFSQFCSSSWAQLWIVLTLAAAAPAYGSEPLVSARNYHEVSETLVSSGQISPAHIASLTDERVELVINLTVEDTDLNAREGFDITALGIDYLHIPVDWDNPTEQNLQLFMHVLDAAGDQKVLVHCFANYRASAFIYLYRTLKQGVAPEIARKDLDAIWPKPAWAQFPQWQAFIAERTL
jgi:protein tyrosine phosphatase (PTP) superfamily phosphohydrolase (DUF442 family)